MNDSKKKSPRQWDIWKQSGAVKGYKRINEKKKRKLTPEQEKCRKEAQDWLGFLRRGDDTPKLSLGYVKKYCAEGGLSLADIGISEKELEALMSKGHRIAAEKWLVFLRRGTEFESFIDYLKRDCTDGGFSLADVGTNENELRALRIRCYREKAARRLEYLRRGCSSFTSDFVGYLKRDCAEGGLSLADVGTSEEELARLVRAAA